MMQAKEKSLIESPNNFVAAPSNLVLFSSFRFMSSFTCAAIVQFLSCMQFAFGIHGCFVHLSAFQTAFFTLTWKEFFFVSVKMCLKFLVFQSKSGDFFHFFCSR